MPPERWQHIKETFEAAFELPPAERSAWLEQACGGDRELQAEVEALLLSMEDVEFLAGSAAEYVPGALTEEAPDLNIGRHVGAWQIVRLIGEGGMGAVYLAERGGDFHQQAAIKLLRPGMDSRTFVRRFRNERQILASLEHPNIARLLDGGTTEDGRLYFIMEYVEGQPLDVYAARHHLGIEERLRLFQQVCAAVQYAHRHLVVHRDIKPGNVLVTGNAGSADGQQPTPKLLDFGIATLLGSDTARQTGGVTVTLTGLRLMTPEYASPEQVRGATITTATDVYSLGAVLYRLLTGHSPLAVPSGSAAEIERAICDRDPRPPSQVAGEAHARELRGDLDTIVLRCLQKDPSRRYGSPEQLSTDIQRYLDGMPIQARPQTWTYRAGRFIRRNLIPVAAAVLATASLIIGLTAALYQAHVAHVERLRAERRFNDVRRLAHTFLFDFHDAIQSLPGATPARHMIVDKALEYLDGLARESAGDISLERELAEAYLRVGDVQGNGGYSNLGDPAGALASYTRAMQIAGRMVRADSRSLYGNLLLARAYQRLGDMRALRDDPAGAVSYYRRAVTVFDAVAPGIEKDVPAQIEVGNAYAALADELGNPGFPNLGDPRGATGAYEKARGIFAGIAKAHPENIRGSRAVGTMDMRMGDVEMGLGDTNGGLRRYQTAVATYEAVLARDPLNPATRLVLGMSVGKVGSALAAAGRNNAALVEYRKAVGIERDLMESDPKNAQAFSTYCFSLQYLAEFLAKTGDRAGALATYRETLGLVRQYLAADPQNPRRQARVAEIQKAVDDLMKGGRR